MAENKTGDKHQASTLARTFESSTQGAHGMKLRTNTPAPRSHKSDELQDGADPQGPGAAGEASGFVISRDLVMRLIDWLKEE